MAAFPAKKLKALSQITISATRVRRQRANVPRSLSATQVIAWLAGDGVRWTCCPVLRKFVRILSTDIVVDEHRTKLIRPVLRKLVWSYSSSVDGLYCSDRRGRMLIDAMVRDVAPLAFDAIAISDRRARKAARVLRELKQIDCPGRANIAREALSRFPSFGRHHDNVLRQIERSLFWMRSDYAASIPYLVVAAIADGACDHWPTVKKAYGLAVRALARAAEMQ